MANTLTMADLLAKQETKPFNIFRGQELTGEVVSINKQEVILDLGTKAEGILPVRDLSPEQLANLKVGDKLQVFVIAYENEYGQVVLGLKKALLKGNLSAKWEKFQQASGTNKAFSGRGVEVNKGGLIIEIGDVRGFLPASQVSFSQAGDLDELIGKDVNVTVIEVDPSQNRLIFSQKTNVSEEAKSKLQKLKIGDKVKGKVAAILPFGIFVSLEDSKGEDKALVEGLVHVSEIAWEKVEDPGKLFIVGDEVETKVISLDPNTNRVNLSIKQLSDDPFVEISKKFLPDDVIKGKVSKISSIGVFFELKGGVEGLIHTSKLEPGMDYEIGQEIQVLVDGVDSAKRRVNLTPFITSTKDLIYK